MKRRFFFMLLPARVDHYFFGSIHIFISYRLVLAVVVNVINTLKSLILSRSLRMFGIDNLIVFATNRTFHISRWFNKCPHPLLHYSRVFWVRAAPKSWLKYTTTFPVTILLVDNQQKRHYKIKIKFKLH